MRRQVPGDRFQIGSTFRDGADRLQCRPRPRSSGTIRQMTRTLVPQLTPFIDALPLPQRLIAEEHHGGLVVRMRMGEHRFHRDMPVSKIWGYEGMVPGPTIEAERGHPVAVEWRNELQGPYPLVVTSAPTHADARGVPVQCVPGLSGGTAEPERSSADRPPGRAPARWPDPSRLRRAG